MQSLLGKNLSRLLLCTAIVFGVSGSSTADITPNGTGIAQGGNRAVTITWSVVCVDCVCDFVNDPTISDSSLLFECEITSVNSVPQSCGPQPGCPDGVIGESNVVNYECCLEGLGVGCVSGSGTFQTCSN